MNFQEFLNANYNTVFSTFFNALKLWKLDVNIWNANMENSFKSLILNILSKFKNATLLYADIEYAKQLLLRILNQHGLMLSIIFERNKDKLNLEFVSSGTNRIGYSGFDIDNQNGQFQSTTNTNNNSQTNTARNWSIYIVFKQQYNDIVNDFEQAVMSNLLQVIY